MSAKKPSRLASNLGDGGAMDQTHEGSVPRKEEPGKKKAASERKRKPECIEGYRAFQGLRHCIVATGNEDDGTTGLPAKSRITRATFRHLPAPSGSFRHLPYTFREASGTGCGILK